MSIEITIIGNRPIIDASDLTPEERQEFDYLDFSDPNLPPSNTFFRHNGTLYDMYEFAYITTRDTEALQKAFGSWDGYMTDSFSSGLLYRYVYPDQNASDDIGSVTIASFHTA